jgi:small subunit ribosomal protein S4
MKSPKKFKICRRLGAGVYEKCQSSKFVSSTAKKAATGKRGPKKNVSDFGAQLIEKQRVRVSYNITERQFRGYINKATATKSGKPTERLFEALETRLDNVIYRLGIANTRQFARQAVSHGHFMVNGRRLTIPSYQVKVGDVITVREGSRSTGIFKDLETKMKNYTWPNWLTFNPATIQAEVKALPKQTDGFLNMNAVLEFYSR